jgi:aquaporin Z
MAGWTYDVKQAALAEAIGVFIFVFSGCAAASSAAANDLFSIAFAFGLAIMVMAFTMGPVSGGHLNPAVTWAFIITGNKFGVLGEDENDDGPNFVAGGFYVAAQLIGAFLGALACRLCLTAAKNESFAGDVSTNPGPNVDVLRACAIEVVTTFSLVFTVFCVAVDKSPAGRGQYAAFPIGLAVVMGILASGKVSGGSMNPARSLGPAVAGAIGKHTGDGLANLWAYFVGPLVGASCAGLLHRHVLEKRHD